MGKGSEITPFKLIWERKWLNLAISCGILIFLILYVFFILEKQYTATTSIFPPYQGFSSIFGENLNMLAGLAGMGPLTGSNISQQMFVGIIHSRKLQTKLLQSDYRFNDDGKISKIVFLDYLEIEGEQKNQVLERAFKMLNDEIIYTEINADNDILNINVTLKNPSLAAQVANRITIYLQEIVTNQVNREYNDQYNYLEKRLSVIGDSIKFIEKSLETFLNNTRDLSLPGNIIEEQRLQRELKTKTEIFDELKKNEEVFTIENLVNTMPVKILDTAIVPHKYSRPKRTLVFFSYFVIFIFLQFIVNVSIIQFRKFRVHLRDSNDV